MNRHLADYVAGVVNDYAIEVDPEELEFPDWDSLSLLRADLGAVIEGRVADWIIEQKEKK